MSAATSESGQGPVVHQLQEQIAKLQTEKRALESQCERYVDFFDFAPDAYLVTNTDGVIQEANRTATTLLNVAHDVLVGKKLERFVAAEDRKLFITQLQRVKAGEVSKLQDWEILLHPYENVPVPAAVTLGVVKGYSGKAVGLRWLFRDISERKKAIEMLRRSKQQLSGFVENAVIPLHSLDQDGKILWANQAELDFLGYSRDEFLGRSVADFHPDPEVVKDMLARLRRNEVLSNFEARMRCGDGSIRHVLIDSNAQWEGNRFLQAWCFLRDITERKMAEEQIRELNNALEIRVRERTRQLEETNLQLKAEVDQRARMEQKIRDASQELERITHSISDYLWSAEVGKDGEFRYLYYSPVVQQITGRPAEYYMTSPRKWLETVHPDDRVRVERKLQEVLRAAPERAEEEYRILLPNGAIRWVRDCVRVKRLGGGKLRLDGVVSDTTDRQSAENKTAFEHETSRILFESEDILSAVSRMLRTVCEHLRWDRGEFWFAGPGVDTLACKAAWQREGVRFPILEEICRTEALSRGIGLAGRIWAARQPIGIPDVSRDATFYHAREAGREGLRGAFGFPIEGRRRIHGVLTFFSTEVRKPDAQFLKFAAVLGKQIGLFFDRIQATEELRGQEEKFRQMVLGIPDPVFLLTPDGKALRDFNPALQQLIGIPEDRLSRLKLGQMIHFEDLPVVERQFARALQTDQPVTISARLRRGIRQWQEVELFLLRQRRRDEVTGLLVFARSPAATAPEKNQTPASKPRAKSRPTRKKSARR